jgi:hypothetical protein
MTTRRRRKSGSGPSATALIAWVGGTPVVAGGPAGAAVSGVHAWSPSRIPGGRAIFVGRACGLAAGTVLACGSILASAVHVDDGSLSIGGRVLRPDHAPANPGVNSGSPVGYSGAVVSVPAPAAVRAQAFAGASPALYQPSVQVHRNSPVSVDMPVQQAPPPQSAQPVWRSPAPPADDAPADSIAPVSPVLEPAASGVDRVAPVDGVLDPAPPSLQTVAPRTQVIAKPLIEQAQPAMTMLSALAPKI